MAFTEETIYTVRRVEHLRAVHGIDVTWIKTLFDLMQQLNEQLGTSFIVVTHDLSLASRMQKSLQLVDGVLQDSACL